MSVQIIQILSENSTHTIIYIPFIQCTSTKVLQIQYNHGIIELEEVIMQ